MLLTSHLLERSRKTKMVSCTVCSQCLVRSGDRRKVESLQEDDMSTLLQLVSAEFPAEADRLLSSHDYFCRPCFRAVGALARIKKDLHIKEQALLEKIKWCGLSRGFGLQRVSTCKLMCVHV